MTITFTDSPQEGSLYVEILDHLKLSLVAERPPLPHIAYQEVFMAAETWGEYFMIFFFTLRVGAFWLLLWPLCNVILSRTFSVTSPRI
jgi:hypothetical protein